MADTEAWSERQRRRDGERLQGGRVPLPLAWERKIRLTAAAESMGAAAAALLDRALAAFREDGACRAVGELLGVAGELRDEAEHLEADVGIPVRATPPPRWRGDPPDVSPYAPPLGDLRAVRRWLREWRVREGRLAPRSAREHAIAVTGARERQAVKDAPEPPPAKRAEEIGVRE